MNVDEYPGVSGCRRLLEGVVGSAALAGPANDDAADGVDCNCHQSWYDPFGVEFDSFVSLPRPD